MNINTQKLWGSSQYYKMAEKGSEDINHPGMKLLLELAMSSKSVLDLGCGEGTRLHLVTTADNKRVGLDISKRAVETARKKYPGIRFIKRSLKEIPFKTNQFDLVYSAYVLEHLIGVKKSLEEAIRVTKKHLVIICPNYGSPNRASPNFTGSRISKLLKGFLTDFTDHDIEEWNKVKPQKGLTETNYSMDDDTTVEPYIHTLLNFLIKKKLKIIYWDTCWDYELPGAFLHQKIFRQFARINIFPFKYWGPHIVVHAVKD